MRLFYLLSLASLLLAQPHFAQNTFGNFKWELPYGTERKEELRNCLITQNAEGIIAMVGQLKNKGLYFVTIDPVTGNEYTPPYIYKGSKGIPTAIIPHRNGFIVCGTTKENRGHALMWSVNPKGQHWKPILPKLFKKIKVVHAIATDAYGNFYLTGQKGDDLCFFKLDRQFRLDGDMYAQNGYETSIGTDLALDGNGSVYIAGHARSKKEVESLLLRFSEEGNFIWSSNEVRNHELENPKLLVTSQDELVLAGTSYMGYKNREDLKVLVTDKDGKILRHKPYEHQGEEHLSALIETPDRHLLLGGYNYAVDSRQSNTLLQMVDLQTLDTLKVHAEGGDWDDRTEDLLMLNNNDVLVLNNLTTKKARNTKPRLTNYPHSPCELKLGPDEDIHFAKDPIYAHEYIENELFTFSGTVVSKVPLDDLDLRVKNKGLGIKSPGVLVFTLLPEYHADQYCYELSKEIELYGGTNQISLKIEKEDVVLEDTVAIFHFPKRPNLHLLSIGIEADDLDYTTHDARDFADLLKQQEGKLFRKVESTVLVSPEETNGTRITDEILALKDRYLGQTDKGSKIEVEDVLMIFLSSHGQAVDGKFYIRATGYRPDNSRTAVDFQADVLDHLAAIECKKLIFIDACKSGSAKGEVDPEEQQLIDEIIKISNMAPGVSIMSSCGPNQKSFEHEDLENGLFTETIVEGLSNQAQVVDENADKVISLQELFQYLRREVPALAFKLHRDESQKQTPYMPRQDLDDSFPIFWLGKKF